MKIRARLLLNFVALALLPLGLILWLAVEAQWALQSRHQDEALQERAEEIAGYLDAYIDSTLEGLRADARQPAFGHYLTATATATATAAARQRQAGELASLLRNMVSRDMVHVRSAALLDLGGRTLLDTAPGREGDPDSLALWVRQVRYSGLASLAGPLVDPQGRAVLHALQPVRDVAGRIVGFLRVSFTAARLQQVVHGKVRRANAYPVLLDGEGVVLAHGRRPDLQCRALVGAVDQAVVARLREERRIAEGVPERLSEVLPAANGGLAWMRWTDSRTSRPDRVTTVPVRAGQWRLVLVEPAEIYWAPRQLTLRAALFMSLLLTALIVGAAWWGARRLARPLVALTEAADVMATPSGIARPLPVDAGGEIGQLARAFGNMTERLQGALREQQARLEEQGRIEARLRDSESRFSNLFHLAPVPVLLTRLGTRTVVDLNVMAEQVFNLSRDQAVGQSLPSLCLTEYEDDLLQALDVLERMRDVDRLLGMHTAHGTGRFRVFARAFEAEGALWAVWTFVDVTEAEHARRALEDLNATLEQRVSERTEALAQALDTLKLAQDELVRSEKLAALATLVAGVAHELNTPIGNSVIVASTVRDMSQQLARDLESDRLRRSVLTRYVSDLGEASDLLERNLSRAHGLVSSFKQVSVDQVGEGRRTFDLADTLRELVATLTPVLRNTPCRLTLEAEPGIRLDSYPGALGQVLTNFVTNAVAHAFDGRSEGHIHIQARLLPTDEVELTCRDDGIGIPGELQKRVFDPFFTTKLGRGGTGLGLHIVYNLVTVTLGGRVELSSEAGQGCCFRLVLPRRAPLQPDKAS